MPQCWPALDGVGQGITNSLLSQTHRVGGAAEKARIAPTQSAPRGWLSREALSPCPKPTAQVWDSRESGVFPACGWLSRERVQGNRHLPQ